MCVISRSNEWKQVHKKHSLVTSFRNGCTLHWPGEGMAESQEYNIGSSFPDLQLEVTGELIETLVGSLTLHMP